MKLLLTIIFIFGLTFPLASIAEGNNHLIGIGQGVSSPNLTSTINFRHGFTHENPLGVIYQDTFRLSGHYDSGEDNNGNDNNGYGGELGIGNGRYGVAIGYYEREDCSSCDEEVAGSIGGNFSGIGIGARFEEEIYTVGLIFNPSGVHRIGLVAELNDPEGDDNNITAFGAGYSYVDSKFTFTVDASKRDYEDEAIDDDLILVTPGLALRFRMISVSVSYDIYVNDEDNSTNDDEIWWGVGLQPIQNFHIAIYGDYFNDLALAASFFF